MTILVHKSPFTAFRWRIGKFNYFVQNRAFFQIFKINTIYPTLAKNAFKSINAIQNCEIKSELIAGIVILYLLRHTNYNLQIEGKENNFYRNCVGSRYINRWISNQQPRLLRKNRNLVVNLNIISIIFNWRKFSDFEII